MLPSNAKDKFHDAVSDGSASVPKDVLAELSRQALTPHRRRMVNGYTLDSRFSADDVATYRKGRTFVLAVNQRHKPGSVDINMGTGEGFSQHLRGLVDIIKQNVPDAKIVTTGATVGSAVLNSDNDKMTSEIVQQTARWSKNR